MVLSDITNNPPKHPHKRHNNAHLRTSLRPNNALTAQRPLLNNNADKNIPPLRLDRKLIDILLNQSQQNVQNV